MDANKSEVPPPHHPFEVKIAIGANGWDFVLRALDEIRKAASRYGAECGMCSGGWDGSFSVDVEKRDISRDVFRDELNRWMEATR